VAEAVSTRVERAPEPARERVPAVPAVSLSRLATGAALRPQQVLALQRTAGNRAVAGYLLRDPAPATLLTPKQAADAAADVSRHYDEDSIRVLQLAATRPRDGKFTAADAEALAQEQQRQHATPSGKADGAFLDFLLKLPAGPGQMGRSVLIHLAVDYADLDVSAALSILHDPALKQASAIDASSGGVGSIRLGDAAFANHTVLVAEIRKQLAKPLPASPMKAVAATVLPAAAAQQEAIAFNAAKLNDRRSIRLVQGFTGARATGAWSADSVRHVAAAQRDTLHVTASGKVDEATLEAIVKALVARGENAPVPRLIIDWYDLDSSHTFNVFYDPQQLIMPDASTPNAETLKVGTGAGGVVRIFDAGLRQPFAELVHTLAHELGHVDQMMKGIDSPNVREFLSEGIEIESGGMRPEPIESEADLDIQIAGGTPSNPGLIDDVARMLGFWDRMTPAEKQANHQRFMEIRAIAISRIEAESTPGQLKKLAPFVVRLQKADASVKSP
jgi:hypothetical protein